MRKKLWIPETGIVPFYINTLSQVEGEMCVPPVGLSGEFEIHKRHRGGNWHQVAKFSNIITNTGMNRVNTDSFGTLANLQFRVGTGAAEPSTSDTGLQSPVGTLRSGDTAYISSSMHSGSGEVYVTARQGTLFDFDNGNGNLTE